MGIHTWMYSAGFRSRNPVPSCLRIESNMTVLAGMLTPIANVSVANKICEWIWDTNSHKLHQHHHHIRRRQIVRRCSEHVPWLGPAGRVALRSLLKWAALHYGGYRYLSSVSWTNRSPVNNSCRRDNRQHNRAATDGTTVGTTEQQTEEQYMWQELLLWE